jgi:FtsH-binding integral membrane protein
MSEKHNIIPVWFFVGCLLLIYGVLILISGLINWSSPPPDVVLSNLHAPVWWGAVLTVLGIVYCTMFRPGKNT